MKFCEPMADLITKPLGMLCITCARMCLPRIGGLKNQVQRLAKPAAANSIAIASSGGFPVEGLTRATVHQFGNVVQLHLRHA